jgi:hypothetical protein
MPGGFHIPAELVDREAGGLALIMHAQSLCGTPKRPIMMAQLLLAEWLLTDPATLPAAVEEGGLDVAAVLSGVGVPLPEGALFLLNLTGGAIRLADWTRAYSAGPATSSPAGGGAAEPSAPPPTPIVQGLLGQTPNGRLFRCIRGEGENRYVLTGLGVSVALDRAAATDIVEVLAQALGITVYRPERRG